MRSVDPYDIVDSPDPICPICFEDAVKIETTRLTCQDCGYREATVHREDETESDFAERLNEMAARWMTIPERIASGDDWDPLDDE